MTHEEAMAGVDRIVRNVFTVQWEQARAAGLTEEEIAERWAKRTIKPPEDWTPPALGEEAG